MGDTIRPRPLGPARRKHPTADAPDAGAPDAGDISLRLNLPPPPANDPPPQAKPIPGPSRIDRLREAALPEWQQAVELATRIEKVTAEDRELLFRIVESEAFSSQRLVTDPLEAEQRGPRGSTRPQLAGLGYPGVHRQPAWPRPPATPR